MMAVEPRWEMAQRQREQSAQLLTQITVAEEKEAALRRDAERVIRELEGVQAARAQLDNLRESHRAVVRAERGAAGAQHALSGGRAPQDPARSRGRFAR